MSDFATLPLPAEPTVTAPDGSDVRVLLSLAGGSMAHFQLAAGAVSKAVRHRTVEEIWYVLGGHGQMWRRQGERDETVDLAPGTCLTIPVGTAFQFRAGDGGPLAAVAITMPPWPGEGEAVFVDRSWPPHCATPSPWSSRRWAKSFPGPSPRCCRTRPTRPPAQPMIETADPPRWLRS